MHSHPQRSSVTAHSKNTSTSLPPMSLVREKGMFRKRLRRHRRVVCGECGALRRTTAPFSPMCGMPFDPADCSFTAPVPHNTEENEERIGFPKKFGAILLTVDIDPAWNITPALVGDLPAYRHMPHRTRGRRSLWQLRNRANPVKLSTRLLLSTAEKTEKRNKKIKHPE